MRSITTLYINKYGMRDNESEEKRVRGLVKKIHEKDSIFCDLPFDYLEESEQLILLHHIMTSLPERQIMANMKKIDVDRCYMNFVYESEKSKDITKVLLENELRGYSPISLADELLNSRFIIRNSFNVNDILEYLLVTNERIIRSYFQESEQFKLLGLKAYNFVYIKEYIDYVSNVILQLLIYKVINQENVETLKIMQVLSEKLDEIDVLIGNQLKKRRESWIERRINHKSDLSAEFVSNCFSMYVTHRSKFYEEFNIKEVLRTEMLNLPSLFGEVQPEYKAEKIFINEKQLYAIQTTIMEGKHIDKFKTKIETTRRFIDIMAAYAGRQCDSLCLQDLKVYFREIFVSKSKYRRRMASCIVKEYIEQVEYAKKEGKTIPEFNKKSQYMFIREKISRGYFREKGLSKEYIEKISFEKRLYDLLLKQYLFYDIQDSLEFIYDINDNLLKVYYTQLIK